MQAWHNVFATLYVFSTSIIISRYVTAEYIYINNLCDSSREIIGNFGTTANSLAKRQNTLEPSIQIPEFYNHEHVDIYYLQAFILTDKHLSTEVINYIFNYPILRTATLALHGGANLQ